jgi:hypothetical protein
VWTGILQGVGLGFLFAPVGVLAFDARTEVPHRSSGIFALSRNWAAASAYRCDHARPLRQVIERGWSDSHAVQPHVEPGLSHYPIRTRTRDAQRTVCREAMMLGYADDTAR